MLNYFIFCPNIFRNYAYEYQCDYNDVDRSSLLYMELIYYAKLHINSYAVSIKHYT